MTETTDIVNEGRALVRRILPMMSQHTDDFRPNSYALWYAYLVGDNAALKQDIDRHLKNGERLNAEITMQLYRHHLIDAAESDVANAQDALLRVLDRAQAQMDSAGSETTRFNASLAEFDTALKAPEAAGSLQAEVSAMAGATARISTTINKLLTDVNQSQAEVARLSLELTRARDEASTDALSGLANRGAFDKALNSNCAKHDSSALSLVMFDIDHFKRVNDDFGHPFGDMVIRTVAEVIHSFVRGRDLAARYGGEEFAVLLLDTNEEEAVELAERIRRQVEDKIYRDGDGRCGGTITISAGAAEHAAGEAPEGLLGRADRALYRSKAAGRNRVMASSG